jgi:diaminopimelate decarboxylase
VTAVAGPVERHDLHDRYDLHHGVWPLTARVTAHRGIAVGGVALTELAGRYGTPAYVLDEADVRERCRRYRQVSPDAEIAYAGKAFLCRAHGALGGRGRAEPGRLLRGRAGRGPLGRPSLLPGRRAVRGGIAPRSPRPARPPGDPRPVTPSRGNRVGQDN